jgi:hypothetical protein
MTHHSDPLLRAQTTASGRTVDRATPGAPEPTAPSWGDWSEHWDVGPAPASSSRRRIDQAVARRSRVVAIATLLVPVLLVPVVLGFTGDQAGRTVEVSGTLLAEPPSQPVAAPPAAAESAPAPAVPAAPASPTPTAPTPAPPASEPPTTTITTTSPPCGTEYEVVAGDFWIRIADGSGAALNDLLAVNGATVDTALFPGRTICLPVGASPPPPPVVTAPAASPPATVAAATSSVASAPTSRATAAPTARPTAPAPTAPRPPAPSTTLPAGSTASAEQVVAIIRTVWPDDLEDAAIEVARRESTFRPTAKNFCCYGVFQIYWDVHKSWLGGLGITSPEQLYDPTLNARAALTLYQRSGGWGPWGG